VSDASEPKSLEVRDVVPAEILNAWLPPSDGPRRRAAPLWALALLVHQGGPAPLPSDVAEWDAHRLLFTRWLARTGRLDEWRPERA
jgi:hypothetical protein